MELVRCGRWARLHCFSTSDVGPHRTRAPDFILGSNGITRIVRRAASAHFTAKGVDQRDDSALTSQTDRWSYGSAASGTRPCQCVIGKCVVHYGVGPRQPFQTLTLIPSLPKPTPARFLPWRQNDDIIGRFRTDCPPDKRPSATVRRHSISGNESHGGVAELLSVKR
jgi:hypothetical protein